MYTQSVLLFITSIQSLPFKDAESSKNFTKFISPTGSSERIYFETNDIYFGCINIGLDDLFQAKCRWLEDYHKGVPNNQCSFLRNNASIDKVNEFLSTLADECNQPNNLRSTLQSTMGSTIYDRLQGYGCWCSTATDFKAGHGPVQNNIDQACKELSESIKCLTIDISDHECPHDFSGHYVAMSPMMMGKNIHEQCVFMNDLINTSDRGWTENQLECAKKRCMVEAKMVMFLVGLGLDEEHRFNADLIHTQYGGQFDFDRTCTRSVGGNLKLEDPKCCGEYPDRYPIYKESQGCCSGERYNKLKRECCLDYDEEKYSLVSLSTCLGEVVDEQL